MDVGLNWGINATTILWWAYLALVWWLHRKLVGYKGITTFTLFLPLTFATDGVLVPLIRDLNYQITGVDLTSYSQYWWSLALMYASLLLGIVFANLWKPKKLQEAQMLDDCDVVENSVGFRGYIFVVLLISFISLIQIYARHLQFDLYSYLTFKMDYAAYADHRYGFADATGGWEFFLYNKLPYGIAPLAIIMVWNARGIARWKRFVFMMVLAFALLQTGHKMPAVFMLVYMVVSSALIKRRLVLDSKTVWACAAISMVALFAIVPIFYLMQGDQGYGSALFWSVERIFLEEPRALQLYFEVYPHIHPFLHGASTNAIATVMGVTDYVPPAVYIPTEVLGLRDTSFPTLFIGEGWADFGYFGVFITSIVAGFLLQLYNIWFYRQKQPKLEETALFLSIVLATYHLHASNLLTSFFSYGIVGNYLIYLFIRRRSNRLSVKKIISEISPSLASPSEA